MSFQAMTWAVEQKVPALQKLVLLMLANRLNHDTGKCIPKIKTLADECGMSETSVKTAMKGLAESGLITIVPRFQESVQLPNAYVLHTGVGRNAAQGGSPDAPGVGRQTPTEPGRLNQEGKQGSPVGSSTPSRPEDVSEQVWSDWLAHRKSKKAAVTETVVAAARRESVKAGMTLDEFLTKWCLRGSQGLEAAWLKDRDGRSSQFGDSDWSKGAV
jgi:hypothetical protein